MKTLSLLFALATTSVWAATPIMSFDSPRGGEVYTVGQAQCVRLGDKTRAKTVRIELSRDAGGSYEILGTIDNGNKANRNVLVFTVTTPASSHCVLRATGTIGKTTSVLVSYPFTINDANPIGTVTTASLADQSVTGVKIADGSITTPKIAAGAITSDKIGSGPTSGGFVLASDGNGGASFVPGSSLPPDARYVKVAGDSMTGALMLNGDPVGALQAATKQYVDAKTGAVQAVPTFTGVLSGDVTGTQESTVVSKVGNQTAANVANGTVAANGATDINTANTIVKRDTNGSFSADTITANLVGDVTGSVTGNAETVTNGIYTTGTYNDPVWLTGVAADKITGQVSVAKGGTGSDLSSTGGIGQYLKQTTSGGPVSVSAIPASDLPNLSDTYVDLVSDQTVSGTKTFTSPIKFPDGTIQGTAAAPAWPNLPDGNVGIISGYEHMVPVGKTLYINAASGAIFFDNQGNQNLGQDGCWDLSGSLATDPSLLSPLVIPGGMRVRGCFSGVEVATVGTAKCSSMPYIVPPGKTLYVFTVSGYSARNGYPSARLMIHGLFDTASFSLPSESTDVSLKSPLVVPGLSTIWGADSFTGIEK